MGLTPPGGSRPARILLGGAGPSTAEAVVLGSGTALLYSAGAPSRPDQNEDGCAVFPYGSSDSVLVVTDGVGGARSGAEAARRTLQSLEASLQEAAEQGPSLRAAILDGIEAANHAIRELGGGAAATVSVVAVEDGAVRPFHVGDSPIVLVGGGGRLKHQTLAHGPVGYAIEAGLLSEKEGMGHEERHLVSNLLGTEEMRIEVGPSLRLAPRDTVLLASDGIFDNLFLEEVVELIRKGPLEDAGRALVRDSLRRMLEPGPGEPSKEDDCTFILYRGANR